MQIREAIRIAFESLWAHKLRSFLTLLGIIISICTLVAVVSFVDGINFYVATKIGRLGLNTFTLQRFSLHEYTDRQAFMAAVKRNPILRMSDYEYLKTHARLPIAVSAFVFGGFRGSGTVKANGQSMDQVAMRGVTPSDMSMVTFEVAQGRFLDHFDEVHRTMVAFIGPDLVTHLFPDVNPLGRHLIADGHRFRVIGVATRQGNVFGNSLDQFIIIPISTYRKLHGNQDSIGISFKVANSSLINPAIDEVRLLMRARHHLSYYDKDNFGIIGSSAIMDLWHRLTGSIAAVAVGVTAIFLVVGGIVIMNIMLAAVTERTREVGIRKALGAKRRDVLWQFLVESAVLSAVGGTIGILVAWLFTTVAGHLSSIPFKLPLSAVIIALFISTAVGLFFGIYPAAKAAKLEPIVALRAEA